jgi:hypothetical protein
MKVVFSAIVASLAALGALAAACSSQSSGSPAGQPDSGEDAGNASATFGADGGDVDAGGDAPAPAPQAFVRIAQVSPDLPPIDVCVAPHGTADFQGPLVGQLAASLGAAQGDAEDVSLPGLGYTQVSAYLPVVAGQYDVRLVAAGATDCTASLAPLPPVDDADGGTFDDAALEAGLGGISDATNLPALAFDTYTTLLIAGDFSPAGTDPSLTITMLTDDAVLAGGAAVLRVINAVPSSSSIDFGFSSPEGVWSPVLASVAFAEASSETAPGYGMVDGNGYLPIAPLAAQAMSARSSGSDAASDVGAAASVEIGVGSIATILVVGGKSGDSASPPALLLCMDNQPSGGLLSDCSIAQ